MRRQIETFGPTRRGGPVFRWLGEPLAIDLANTVMVIRDRQTVDLLATPADLDLWLRAERARLGECGFAVAHLGEIRALRDAAHGALDAAAHRTALPTEAVRHVNAASAAAPIAAQLELSSDGEPRAVDLTAQRDPLTQLLGKLARSAITLLTGPERESLHVCGAPSCGMFFLGARRWCCAACGNRARAARHYHRTQARAGTKPRSA